MNEPRGKTISPSDSVDGCIARVESGLVLMTANGQPQWGSTATLAERMRYYQMPGVSIAVLNAYKIDWVKGWCAFFGDGRTCVSAARCHRFVTW